MGVEGFYARLRRDKQRARDAKATQRARQGIICDQCIRVTGLSQSRWLCRYVVLYHNTKLEGRKTRRFRGKPIENTSAHSLDDSKPLDEPSGGGISSETALPWDEAGAQSTRRQWKRRTSEFHVVKRRVKPLFFFLFRTS